VTFALYADQEGGSPIWMETQNVQADGSGEYTALLGATRNDGIPAEVFGGGQRWLGVQAQGEAERPRVLMTSVPYSLKAVDSETLGGLPASAFALAGTVAGTAGHATIGASTGSAKPAATPAAITGAGTAGYVPLWSSGTVLGNSAMLQSGENLGIGAAPGSGFRLYVASSASASSGIYAEATGSTGAAVQGQASATSGATTGVFGVTESSTGYGVVGWSESAEGATYGVFGRAASVSGMGVEGNATATTGDTFGVYGITASTSGTGVKGVGVAVSQEGAAAPAGSGLWGDTSSGAQAVLATADDTAAIAAYSKSNSEATVFVLNESTESNSEVLSTFGSAFTGYCNINVVGNLLCSGSVGGHAILPNGAGGSRDVALYAVQAPENWFEDTGSGQLNNGVAVVALDADYVQTVNTAMDYHVFLTPKGDCKGLYVANETAGGFEVHELGGGNSSIAFDYRIMAKRKGFENIRMADLTGKVQIGRRLKSADGVPPARAGAAGPVGAVQPPARIATLPAQAAKPAHSGVASLSSGPR
jgi:hypothetical protein